MLSAIHSRWGRRLGQKKAAGESNNLCKTKRPETVRFRVFLARREGFEPPAFWSVGCPKEKTEPFRLRFKLFTAVCWTDFPLFPSGIACSNPNLGQKWVKGGTEDDWLLSLNQPPALFPSPELPICHDDAQHTGQGIRNGYSEKCAVQSPMAGQQQRQRDQ